jgi:hypothetical protein
MLRSGSHPVTFKERLEALILVATSGVPHLVHTDRHHASAESSRRTHVRSLAQGQAKHCWSIATMIAWTCWKQTYDLHLPSRNVGSDGEMGGV